jgi:arginyl-tRNA synthetase
MHIGHLRATILGQALANLYKHSGIRPITWNHIGDWGTQFGKLLVAYEKWGDPALVAKNPIEELQKLYVLFHQKAQEDKTLEDEARKEFQKLETGNSKNYRLWKYIVRQSLREFNRMYHLLRTKFDYTIGESFYESRLQPFIHQLKELNIAIESEGALIIPFSDPQLPPALIQKSDGATLYLTRDLVSLHYRAQKIKPIRMLYIVGNEQALHFKQLQEANKIIGITSIPFEHIGFGLVLNALGKKFSSRTGSIVTAQEVLSEVMTRAQEIQKEKNSSYPASIHTSQALGLGVIQYSMLRSNRTSDISFDFDAMFALSGNSFPYLQYTYARSISLLAKAPKAKHQEYTHLSPADYTLIQSVSEFEYAIDASISARSLHHLTDYLFSLANAINALYEQSRIIGETNTPIRDARIQLITLASKTIKYGLGILGIEVQKRM